MSPATTQVDPDTPRVHVPSTGIHEVDGTRMVRLYNYAWFVSFAISFTVYVALTLAFGRARPAAAAPQAT